MTFLLDVNVLIALVDAGSLLHADAHRWFEAEGRADFATCPIGENGVLRIVGNPRYPGSPGSPALVAAALASFHATPGHHFWPDDLTLITAPHVTLERITSHSQVTDTYLLALAVARGGQLATFDRRIVTSAVMGGREALRLLP